jgi:predicted DNA-binding protein (MmcQ/YjbR family)
MKAKPATKKQLSDWCEQEPHATLDFPFGEQTAVYKIGGKMFALLSLESAPTQITLKVVPEDGAALRAEYTCVREGYYMNKQHWITVEIVEEIPSTIIRELIKDSYELVFKSLPKKTQTTLAAPS